jgi:hypothetical protein
MYIHPIQGIDTHKGGLAMADGPQSEQDLLREIQDKDRDEAILEIMAQQGDLDPDQPLERLGEISITVPSVVNETTRL